MVLISTLMVLNGDSYPHKVWKRRLLDSAMAVLGVDFKERAGKLRPSLSVAPAGQEVLTKGLLGPATLKFVSGGEEWKLSVLAIDRSKKRIHLTATRSRSI